MIRFFQIAFFLLTYFPAYTQIAVKQPGLPYKNIYAVIVGISDYKPDDNIPPLKYAHRDAEEFNDFLRSKAGGSVPEDHIKLLINKDATVAAVYNALDWLTQTTTKDDLVYFYFAGHGDKESQTIFNLGFLLTYNTQSPIYNNNALRIEDLNNIANTLSVRNNAKVVLITDACHSGDLSTGAFHFSGLIGESLSKVQRNEVRILSCQTDQLSAENKNWGGGRGVFSYYLVNGLKGNADKDGDGMISVRDIRNYIDSGMKRDPVLIENSLKQDPVFSGSDTFKLAKVDKETADQMQLSVGLPAPIVSDMVELPKHPSERFFDELGTESLENIYDFAAMDKLPAKDLGIAMIDSLLGWELSILSRGSFWDSMALLKTYLNEDDGNLKRFNDKLVETISNRGQEIINLYLKGDAAELERRSYYNYNSSGYEEYPHMFSVASKLTSSKYLQRMLEFDEHYFQGVVYRLQIPVTGQHESLLAKAIKEQNQAIELNDNAACAQNEMGVLLEMKGDLINAEKYFVRATQIVPDWVIPWSNLTGLYVVQKNYQQGLNTAHISDSLKADFFNTVNNLGVLHENQKNYLLAEEYYRKAVTINSRPYYPFERMGYVYSNTTQYEVADSMFFEAEKRKKGYHFEGTTFLWISPMAPPLAGYEGRCDIDTAKIPSYDVMSWFYWAMDSWQIKNLYSARYGFRKVIAADPKDPLVFHYMGQMLYQDKNWKEAEVLLKFAIQYHLSDSQFFHHVDSLENSKKYSSEHECVKTYYSNKIYNEIEDHYLLASIYEKWGHYDEAETVYRRILQIDQNEKAAYAKLWQLMESQARVREAETFIKNYEKVDPYQSFSDLAALYERNMQKDPLSPEWPYKLGLINYEKASNPAVAPMLDTIVYFPIINKEIFLGIDERNNLLTRSKESQIENEFGVKTEAILSPLHISTNTITIYITDETVFLSPIDVYTPRKKAVEYLLKASQLIGDPQLLGDINFKIGNVYVWAGSNKNAYTYYEKAIGYQPDNAAFHLKMVDVANTLYKNSKAYESLDHLYKQNQINFPGTMLFATYNIHSGKFDLAEKLLNDAESVYPYNLPAIIDLRGRMMLLSKRSKEAIKYYQLYLTKNKDDANTMYSIARAYQMQGNKAVAWKWLTDALKNGFNYYFVVRFDPTWAAESNTPKWKKLLSDMKLARKFYPDEKSGAINLNSPGP